MTLLLTVMDRLVLLSLLPEPGAIRGSFVAIKETRELRESLGFGLEESKALAIEQDEEGFRWDGARAAAAGPKEVMVPEFLLEKMRDNAEMMDRKEQLPEEWLDTLLKIGYEGVDDG
jgi:hypothetical protein